VTRGGRPSPDPSPTGSMSSLTPLQKKTVGEAPGMKKLRRLNIWAITLSAAAIVCAVLLFNASAQASPSGNFVFSGSDYGRALLHRSPAPPPHRPR